MKILVGFLFNLILNLQITTIDARPTRLILLSDISVHESSPAAAPISSMADLPPGTLSLLSIFICMWFHWALFYRVTNNLLRNLKFFKSLAKIMLLSSTNFIRNSYGYPNPPKFKQKACYRTRFCIFSDRNRLIALNLFVDMPQKETIQISQNQLQKIR